MKGSSLRNTSVPPNCCARCCAVQKVRAWPRCRRPVGDGARRPRYGRAGVGMACVTVRPPVSILQAKSSSSSKQAPISNFKIPKNVQAQIPKPGVARHYPAWSLGLGVSLELGHLELEFRTVHWDSSSTSRSGRAGERRAVFATLHNRAKCPPGGRGRRSRCANRAGFAGRVAASGRR